MEAMLRMLKRSRGNAAADVVNQKLDGLGDQLGREVDELLRTHRCCRVLREGEFNESDGRVVALAWMCLENEMALVPGGAQFARQSGDPTNPLPEIEAFYLDRYAVTNAQFAEFVADGGYGRTELWPQEIWPSVLQCVDQSGMPGPRFWRNGRPARQQANLPVTGVNWYEAAAYAAWAGKRLPGSLEWQHACTWCVASDGRTGDLRYPWGNTFDSNMANTWQSGHHAPVAVDEYYDGATPNGVYQMIGNVWEWVATPYRCGATRKDITIFFEQPMAEIRGGAFDTYFEDQATARFRTGMPYLFRRPNVGFRCCVTASELKTTTDPAAFLS